MAYVVRLITVALIIFSISVLGLHFYLLKVRQNSTAAAGTQSLNESWQVFSCFSQLTSCSHTAIK
jgi:Tfp pilus assembly protein PilV